MSGAISHHFLASLDYSAPLIGGMIVGPLLAAIGAWFLIARTDRMVHFMFPHLEWEHTLGWLNIKAERRANTALRWMRYGINILLFDALVIMIWTAQDFPNLADGTDSPELFQAAWRAALIVFCFVIWVLYLGCVLLPRARVAREQAALAKYRAEAEEAEREKTLAQLPSRIRAAVVKPRADGPIDPPPNRNRRFNQPGG
jgi:signal transduction histidine kinase